MGNLSLILKYWVYCSYAEYFAQMLSLLLRDRVYCSSAENIAQLLSLFLRCWVFSQMLSLFSDAESLTQVLSLLLIHWVSHSSAELFLKHSKTISWVTSMTEDEEIGRNTNILLIDTPTLISVLVMVVLMLKLFNNAIKTNSVGNTSLVAGRSRRSAKMYQRQNSSFRRRYQFHPNHAINQRQSFLK